MVAFTSDLQNEAESSEMNKIHANSLPAGVVS